MSDSSAIAIQLNGEPREFASALSVIELLTELGIATRAVAVERNEQLVPRAAHATTRIAPGDRLEIVTLVGGG